MTALLALFSKGVLSSILGGFTGILGTVLTARTERKRMEVEHAHEEKMEALDQESMRLEYELRTKQAQIEGDAKTAQSEAESAANKAESDSKALVASLDAEAKGAVYATGEEAKKSKWFIYLDVARGAVRIVATLISLFILVIMLGLAFYIYYTKGGEIDAKELLAQAEYMVFSVNYVATTCVLWWFGARAKDIKGIGTWLKK